MYGNALGVNGAQGSADALKAFQSSNPGYQFQLDQGMGAVEANAAKNGQLNSGNTNLDLLKFGQGLANTTYGNWVQNLQPYLSNSTTNAAGVAQGYQGMGTALNNSFTNQGNAAYGAQTSIGNANANADLAKTGANANILGALSGFLNPGAQTAGQNGGAAGMGASAANGIGNLASLLMFADGGRPDVGKPAIVGERGPEIFVPDQPGTVIPNEQSFRHRHQNFAGGLTDFATDEPGGNPFEVAASRVRKAAVSPRQPGPITHTLNAVGSIPWAYTQVGKHLWELSQRTER